MRYNNTQDHNTDCKSIQSTENEDSLLEIIQENSGLPENEQARYQHLLSKCENKIISLEERAEYQTLLNQLETRNLKRIEALIDLAQIKRKRYGKL